MNYILFDDEVIRKNLLPLTFTRPTGEIRIGITTIREKWEYFLKSEISYKTQGYLQNKFPLITEAENVLINGAVCPNEELVLAIGKLELEEKLIQSGVVIAVKTKEKSHLATNLKSVIFPESFTIIKNLPDIFLNNGSQLRFDFEWFTKGKISEEINDKHTITYKPKNIFIEKGAKIMASVINAENGPVYIGKDVVIQEGGLVRGPFAILEGSHLSMGSKMRGDITIGPFCKIGGEVSNSVIFGYSNKSHEGYLGNSILGEWCNLGADTNTSNMKNNYGNVKLWNYAENGFVDSGRQFCGLIMADHSKAGINTMFNTGTVVGVNCNVFGGGFPPTHIPSFSWGGANGFEKYEIDKALKVAEIAMERRQLKFDETEARILKYIFENT